MEKSPSCGGRNRDGRPQPISSGLSGSTSSPSAVGLPEDISPYGVTSRTHTAECESRPCHRRRGLTNRWRFAGQSSVPCSVRTPCQQQPTLLQFFRRRQSANQQTEAETPSEQTKTGRSARVGGENCSPRRTLRQCEELKGSCTRSPDLLGVTSPCAEGLPIKGREASKNENSVVLPFSLQEEEKMVELIIVGSSSDESDEPSSGNVSYQLPSVFQQQPQETVRKKSLRCAPFPTKDVGGNESRDTCPIPSICDLSSTPKTTRSPSVALGEPTGIVTIREVEAEKQNHVPVERQLSMFACCGTSAQSIHPAFVPESTSGTDDLSSVITEYDFAVETISKTSALSSGAYGEDRKRKRTGQGSLRVVVPKHQRQDGFSEEPDVSPGFAELTGSCREDVEGKVAIGGPCKLLDAAQDPPTSTPSTGSAVVSLDSRKLLHSASQRQELESSQAFHGNTEKGGARLVHRSCASVPWRWAFLVPVYTCLEASCSYNAHLFSPTEMRWLRVLARAVGLPYVSMENTSYLSLHVVDGNSAALSFEKRAVQAHHEQPVCDEEKEVTDTVSGTKRPLIAYPRNDDRFSHQGCRELIHSMEGHNDVSRSCLQSVPPGKQHLDCRRLLSFPGLLVETPADNVQGRLDTSIPYSCRDGYLGHDNDSPQSAATPHVQSRVPCGEVDSSSRDALFVSRPVSAVERAADTVECVLPVESCVRGRRDVGQVITGGPDAKSSKRILLTGDGATTDQHLLELTNSFPRYSADAPLPAGACYLLCRLLVFLARKGSLREVDFGLREFSGKVLDRKDVSRSTLPQGQEFSDGRALSSGGVKSKVERESGSLSPPDKFWDMGVHHAGQVRDTGSLLRRVTPSAALGCESCARMGAPRVWLRLHPFLERSRREVTDSEAALAELRDRGLITLWKWEYFCKAKEEDCDAESSEQETQTKKSSHLYGGGADDMSGTKVKTQEQPMFLHIRNASGEHAQPSSPVLKSSGPADARAWVAEPPTVTRGLDIDETRRRVRDFACDIVGALHCLTVPELQRAVSVVVASIRPSPPASLHTFYSTLGSVVLRLSPFSTSCLHSPSPGSPPVPGGTPRFLTLSVPVTSRIGRLLPVGLLPCTGGCPTPGHCESKLGVKEKELPVVYRKKSDCLGFLLAVTQIAVLDSCGELEGRDFPLIWSPPSPGAGRGTRGSPRRMQEASKMKKLTHFFGVAPRRSPGSTMREGGRQEQTCGVDCVSDSPSAGKEAAVVKSGSRVSELSSASPGAVISRRRSDGEILLRLLQGVVLYIVGGLLRLKNAELLQAWRIAYFSFHVIHTTSSAFTSRLYAPPSQHLLWGDTSVLTDEDSCDSEAETTTPRRLSEDVGQTGEKTSNAKDNSDESRQTDITSDRECGDEMKVRDAKLDGEVQDSTIVRDGISNRGCSRVVDARRKEVANTGKVADSIQECGSPHSESASAALGESLKHEEGQSEGECREQRGKNWLDARDCEERCVDHKRSPRSANDIAKGREHTIFRAPKDSRRRPERVGEKSRSSHSEVVCRRQRKESSILACGSAVISPAVMRLTNLVLQQLHLKLPQRERQVLNHAESQRQTLLCQREDCPVLPTSVPHFQQTGGEDLLACSGEEGKGGQRRLHARARQENQGGHFGTQKVFRDGGKGGSSLFSKCGSRREVEWVSLSGAPVFRCVCSICTIQREKGCVFRSRKALLTYAYAKLEKWRLGALLWKGAGGRRLPSVQKTFHTQDDEPVEMEVLRMADKAATSLLKYVQTTEASAAYYERGQENTSHYLSRHAVWETGAQQVGEEATLVKGSWAGRMTQEREECFFPPSLVTVKRDTAIRKKVIAEKKDQGRTAECEKHETLENCLRRRQEPTEKELRSKVPFREARQEKRQSSVRAFKQCEEDVERGDVEEIAEGPVARRERYRREEEKKGEYLQLGEICERTKELRHVPADRCPPSDFIRFTPQFVWSVSISHVIELLEQRKQHETAVKLLKLLIRFYQLQQQLSLGGQQTRHERCAFLSERDMEGGCYRRYPRGTEEIEEGCRSAESEVRDGSLERQGVWDCGRSVDGTRDMNDVCNPSVRVPFINCRQAHGDVANGEEIQGEMPLRPAACAAFTKRLGKWYNRLMVLLKVHLKRPEEALVAAVACLREPSGAVSLAERLEISRRATGLARMLFSPGEKGQGRAEANKRSAAVPRSTRLARRSAKGGENGETASELDAEDVLTDTRRRRASGGKKKRRGGRQKGSDVREVGAEEGEEESEETPVRVFSCWKDILLCVIERSTGSLSCCGTPLFHEDLCIYSSVFRRNGEDIRTEILLDRVRNRENQGDNSVATRSKRRKIKKESPVFDSSCPDDDICIAIPPCFALFPQDVQKHLLEAKEYQELLQTNLPHTVVYARPLEAGQQSGKASVFFGWDGSLVGVEDLCLQHYAMAGGWQGIHDEGRILRMLFRIMVMCQDSIFLKSEANEESNLKKQEDEKVTYNMEEERKSKTSGQAESPDKKQVVQEEAQMTSASGVVNEGREQLFRSRKVDVKVVNEAPVALQGALNKRSASGRPEEGDKRQGTRRSKRGIVQQTGRNNLPLLADVHEAFLYACKLEEGSTNARVFAAETPLDGKSDALGRKEESQTERTANCNNVLFSHRTMGLSLPCRSVSVVSLLFPVSLLPLSEPCPSFHSPGTFRDHCRDVDQMPSRRRSLCLEEKRIHQPRNEGGQEDEDTYTEVATGNEVMVGMGLGQAEPSEGEASLAAGIVKLDRCSPSPSPLELAEEEDWAPQQRPRRLFLDALGKASRDEVAAAARRAVLRLYGTPLPGLSWRGPWNTGESEVGLGEDEQEGKKEDGTCLSPKKDERQGEVRAGDHERGITEEEDTADTGGKTTGVSEGHQEEARLSGHLLGFDGVQNDNRGGAQRQEEKETGASEREAFWRRRTAGGTATCPRSSAVSGAVGKGTQAFQHSIQFKRERMREACARFFGKIAYGMGGQGLSDAFRLLSQDFAYWAGGLPDLLLWRDVPRRVEEGTRSDGYEGSTSVSDAREHTEAGCGGRREEVPWSAEVRFVEVKGPRDRLSEKQRCWLAYFLKTQIACEVCKVLPPSVLSSGLPGSSASHFDNSPVRPLFVSPAGGTSCAFADSGLPSASASQVSDAEKRGECEVVTERSRSLGERQVCIGALAGRNPIDGLDCPVVSSTDSATALREVTSVPRIEIEDFVLITDSESLPEDRVTTQNTSPRVCQMEGWDEEPSGSDVIDDSAVVTTKGRNFSEEHEESREAGHGLRKGSLPGWSRDERLSQRKAGEDSQEGGRARTDRRLSQQENGLSSTDNGSSKGKPRRRQGRAQLARSMRVKGEWEEHGAEKVAALCRSAWSRRQPRRR